MFRARLNVCAAKRLFRMRNANSSSKSSSTFAEEHPDAPDYSKLSPVPDYSSFAAGIRIGYSTYNILLRYFSIPFMYFAPFPGLVAIFTGLGIYFFAISYRTTSKSKSKSKPKEPKGNIEQAIKDVEDYPPVV